MFLSKRTKEIVILNVVPNVDNCGVVFCKKCDIELETECKAGIVLAILQTQFRDLVHEFQVSVIAFQVPFLVCKQLGKTVKSCSQNIKKTFHKKHTKNV